MLLERGKRTGLALLDGDLPAPELLEAWLAESALFVCADGAADAPLPRLPDAVVGDMDSLRSSDPRLRRVRVPDPRHNDAEKCLQFLLDEGCDRFVLLGGTGGRQDHHLVSLSLPLFRPGELLLAGDDFEAMGVTGRVEMALPAGRGLSLFPLHGPARSVTLSGVEYPLHDAALDVPRGLSASNRVTDPRVVLEMSRGRLLLIVERRPGDPLWRTTP